MKFRLASVFILFSIYAYSQDSGYKTDRLFFDYLIKNSLSNDAAKYIELNNFQGDSLLYYR